METGTPTAPQGTQQGRVDPATALYGTPPEEVEAEQMRDDSGQSRETLDAMTKLQKDFSEFKDGTQARIDSLTAENNRLRSSFEGKDKNTELPDDRETITGFAQDLHEAEKKLEEIDTAIERARERGDTEEVVKLKKEQRRWQSRANDTERRFIDHKKSREDLKRGIKNKENANQFRTGIAKALRAFPELNNGKGGIDQTSPLAQMTLMVLQENAQRSKYAGDIMERINPEFDNRDGYLNAVRQAKIILLQGGATGGSGGQNHFNNAAEQGLSGSRATGGSFGGGGEKKFGGVTEKELRTLRNKANGGDSQALNLWINKSKVYNDAKSKWLAAQQGAA